MKTPILVRTPDSKAHPWHVLYVVNGLSTKRGTYSRVSLLALIFRGTADRMSSAFCVNRPFDRDPVHCRIAAWWSRIPPINSFRVVRQLGRLATLSLMIMAMIHCVRVLSGRKYLGRLNMECIVNKMNIIWRFVIIHE